MGRNKYEPSEGPDQYRRTLYAFWRRSAAPSFLFDNAQRRVCEVRTARTNTPLQALTLLNDEVFVEAAQAMAQRVLNSGGANAGERIRYAYELCLARLPEDSEAEKLVAFYEKQKERFQNGHDPADLISQSVKSDNSGVDAIELAAWTTVCRVLLNLDEMITKG